MINEEYQYEIIQNCHNLYASIDGIEAYVDWPPFLNSLDYIYVMYGRSYARRRRARDMRRAQERAERQEHRARDLGDPQEQMESSG
jgi:hypothetical protein